MNFQPYDSDADWVITGVPFDMATSGRAGGRHGPAAIRQVSTNLAWEHNRFPWNFDMRETSERRGLRRSGVRVW
ncbi:Agmatinase [Yokenella regensburgei]|nr:Agmatinase [Yokenella regensburgei]